MSQLEQDAYRIYNDLNGNVTDCKPGPRIGGAGTLIGKHVYNRQGEDLGDIKEIMLELRSGKVKYVVLSFEGFLGTAGKLFAVPWSALNLNTLNKRFEVDVPRSRLKNAPGFDQDNWPDIADSIWADQVHAYYGTKPDQTHG